MTRVSGLACGYFQEHVGSRADRSKRGQFASNLHYQHGEYGQSDDFANLAKRLTEKSKAKKLAGNPPVLFVHPSQKVYKDIVEQLGKAGLAKPTSANSWVRIIIEKPFGRDLASAKRVEQDRG